MGRPKKFPPPEPWTLKDAHAQVNDIAKWAYRMGFRTIAPRLEWAASIIAKHVDEAAGKGRT